MFHGSISVFDSSKFIERPKEKDAKHDRIGKLRT